MQAVLAESSIPNKGGSGEGQVLQVYGLNVLKSSFCHAVKSVPPSSQHLSYVQINLFQLQRALMALIAILKLMLDELLKKII